MAESGYVPIALACGHVVEEMAQFQYDPARIPRTLIECPEGCGWQQFVVEPGDEGGCLCPNPLDHICGRDLLIFDLGDRDAGDVIELELGAEDG